MAKQETKAAIEYPIIITNFDYNGFSGRQLPGSPPYTARFAEWTSDPGVAKFECSDGKTRLIPTFAIEDYKKVNLPKQTYENGKTIFGAPSKS